MRVLLLHPGAMGESVGLALLAGQHEVAWVSRGRSAETATRAANFRAFDELAQAVSWAEVIVSVCPPHAALTLAETVSACGFGGTYVDANAVAPATAGQIAALFTQRYVDGGIIGPPAHAAGTTRLYLAGKHAPQVAALFSSSVLDARVIDEQTSTEKQASADKQTTAASALKMAYAAYTKGNSALLLAVHALADAAGVRAALEAEWDLSQPGLRKRSSASARGVAPKAWRFVGEMEEIAATFAAYQLPDEFHQGAREVYQRLAELKDVDQADLEAVLAALNAARNTSSD